MFWKDNVKNWDGKLYKILQGNKSCHGGNFEWSLPKDGKPGNWTSVIEDVRMCLRGYHLTTHYAHWSDEKDVSIYEAEGDVVEFDGYDKVVCTRARLLKLVENPFNECGYCNSGNYNSGDCNSGSMNSGNNNSGNWNSGDNNSGHRNSGFRNLGDFNSGSYNLGDYNSGSRNSGNCNLGDRNSGNFNTGCWNYGDRNFGYFCNNFPPIMLFDKQVPNDLKLTFPKWIYFDLLPEGYYKSWQKAFENADVKGIKELLALPNFDYEIFEEISSITKKQIKDKIRGMISYKKLKVSNINNWNGKLYKVLKGNKSFHGGDFEWSLPKDGNPGDWTPIIEDVKMCNKGYHLTTHYVFWSDKDVSIYEAEGDVVEFDGYDKVVCTRARLLRLVENPFNKDNSGDFNFGFKNSGNRNLGNYNSGNNNSGEFNSGNYNSGNNNSGDYNLGYKNTGDCNSGNYNSGYWNSGNYNIGNWNSGNRNYGYFCRNSSSIIMFNKQIPNDWKSKFPSWICFELLPEGYHASWQKAFESADVKGIKELLELPNFDYEIFEDISSITKEQIKEKLGE